MSGKSPPKPLSGHYRLHAWEVNEGHWAALSSLEKCVWPVLCLHRNSKTGLCCPSLDVLAYECGIIKKSAVAAVKQLEARGWLSITKQNRRVGGVYNTYNLIHSYESSGVQNTPERGVNGTPERRVQNTPKPHELVPACSVSLTSLEPKEQHNHARMRHQGHVVDCPFCLKQVHLVKGACPGCQTILYGSRKVGRAKT